MCPKYESQLLMYSTRIVQDYPVRMKYDSLLTAGQISVLIWYWIWFSNMTRKWKARDIDLITRSRSGLVRSVSTSGNVSQQLTVVSYLDMLCVCDVVRGWQCAGLFQAGLRWCRVAHAEISLHSHTHEHTQTHIHTHTQTHRAHTQTKRDPLALLGNPLSCSV